VIEHGEVHAFEARRGRAALEFLGVTGFDALRHGD
jgi:hypothetical protein